MIGIASQESRWPAHLFARRRRKWFLAWLPHRDRRLHAHYILQTEFRYSGPELPIDAIAGIGDDHSTRDILSHGIPDLTQRYLRFRLELDVFGNAGRIRRCQAATKNRSYRCSMSYRARFCCWMRRAR